MGGVRLTKKGASLYPLQFEGGAGAERRRMLFVSSLPLARSIREGVDKVNARIASFKRSDFSGKELFDSATYTLKRQGKMVRPALVLLGAKLIGEDTNEFVDMATAAELLHTASLVHDDIIDRDMMRRGTAAAHVKYGQETALLAGDALIAKAVSMAARYGPKVVKTVADASIDMCAGELLDYSFQKDAGLPGVREYLRMARLKNGVFMGTCASIAATYRRSKKSLALYGFGLSLGVAFQIRDDIIEIVDAGERRANGGRPGERPSPNLVNVFARQFGIDEEEAVENAIGLNNYFADHALRFVEGEREIAPYVDFVRVRSK
ncbi:MAG: polyprenyl synthetase family protein [Candidatus Micrarchaeota archaeon]|nr:polyprenyl synthetase family protein [Candidatus Micrarchaeota archaeon]